VLCAYDGPLEVDYGQAYVVSRGAEGTGDLHAAFAGQSNGLLGAALPGRLVLLTSRSSGEVPFRIEVWEAAPKLDEDWEDCVEASFRPVGLPVILRTMMTDAAICEIPLGQRWYRVRFSARGMEGAWDLHAFEAEGTVDSYALTFWPAPPAPDTIITEGSATARSMHESFPQPSP
jgi:hypothetical protein